MAKWLHILWFILGLSMIGNSQNLSKYFVENNVAGSIALFDYQKQKWIISDDQAVHEGTLPASTFKILHSLIALEEKTIHGVKDTMKWDGIPKMFKTFKVAAWNQDTDLEMAFKNSTIWYFSAIAKKIKTRKYKKYLKTLKYGNRKIRHGKDDDFWNFGKFKVSPVQQLELLIQLYEEKLPFQNQHQKTVKDLMKETQNEAFTLRSKTGWCYDRKDIGWYIGYVELQENVIFFATRIQKDLDHPKKDFSKLRKRITKNILADLYSISWK